MDNDLTAKVELICLGRFHHFHLARELHKRLMLGTIWSGYPRRQLKSEDSIPPQCIKTFPWIQAPYMAAARYGLHRYRIVDLEWQWLARTSLDRYVSNRLSDSSVLIALSGCGLLSGKAAKAAGARYYCDRGSTHIRHQDEVLRDEYARWGLEFPGIDPRIIEREEQEYALADRISVPSSYVAKTFTDRGITSEKIFVNPYGARLERFSKVGEPDKNAVKFLFVGHVSIRKGFMYLLKAFQQYEHPRKELVVVGSLSDDVRSLLQREDLTGVKFSGLVPNTELSSYYSTATAMILPSLEEGLAMVIGEAMACGCPVIATAATGIDDFLSDGSEGRVVGARDVNEILEAMWELSDLKKRCLLSAAAINRVRQIEGWSQYGERWSRELI